MAILLRWYFTLFLRAINLVSRRQEYRADELACLIAGPANLIDGLRTIHATSIAWPAYWKNEVVPVLSEGCLAAIGDGLTRFMSLPEVTAVIGKTFEERLVHEKIDPYDTHPPLRERIAAAQMNPDPLLPADTRPASSLLENLQATETNFVERCVAGITSGSLSYVPWDEVKYRVTIPAWQKFVDEYPEPLKGVSSESIPDQVPKFHDIGSRIRDPKGILLDPEQRTARAANLFAAALCLAMIREGWELQVQPGVFRLSRGEHDFDPFDSVARLRGGLSPQEWVARVRELGISHLALDVMQQAPDFLNNQPIPEKQ